MGKELKTLLRDKLLEDSREPKGKVSFWASETDLNQFDLYHRFMDTVPTNPMDLEAALALGTRTLVEDSFVQKVRELGLLIEPPEGEHQHRIDIVREGIAISGKLDGLLKQNGGSPLEFKTSFGRFGKMELEAGTPKIHYLKQLAIYMDGMDADYGCLVQAHFKDTFIIDEIYQFNLIRKEGTKFQCNGIEFDLDDTYKRWADIKKNFIDKGIEPPSEYKYKFDLDTIDWKTIPKYKIANARNNKAVIGDWQVIYSGYKNLIIEREGTKLGYSIEEQRKIVEATKGYTTWNK